jgi:hypothetical protein
VHFERNRCQRYVVRKPAGELPGKPMPIACRRGRRPIVCEHGRIDRRHDTAGQTDHATTCGAAEGSLSAA